MKKVWRLFGGILDWVHPDIIILSLLLLVFWVVLFKVRAYLRFYGI